MRLEDVKRRKGEDVLHEREHSSPEEKDACAPAGELVRRWTWCTPDSRHMFDPHGAEGLLDMLEVKQESEEELVPQDGLARNDQR